ncbi:probable methyltransferase [Pediococcus acidilactici NGRI 0510Q]|nr:probable methyltransferase [Pediococcus acidilactici NGRI 0510Q]
MELDLLAKDVTIVCETSEEVELPAQIGWLAKTREQRYGITKIVIYKAGS